MSLEDDRQLRWKSPRYLEPLRIGTVLNSETEKAAGKHAENVTALNKIREKIIEERKSLGRKAPLEVSDQEIEQKTILIDRLDSLGYPLAEVERLVNVDHVECEAIIKYQLQHKDRLKSTEQDWQRSRYPGMTQINEKIRGQFEKAPPEVLPASFFTFIGDILYSSDTKDLFVVEDIVQDAAENNKTLRKIFKSKQIPRERQQATVRQFEEKYEIAFLVQGPDGARQKLLRSAYDDLIEKNKLVVIHTGQDSQNIKKQKLIDLAGKKEYRGVDGESEDTIERFKDTYSNREEGDTSQSKEKFTKKKELLQKDANQNKIKASRPQNFEKFRPIMTEADNDDNGEVHIPIKNERGTGVKREKIAIIPGDRFLTTGKDNGVTKEVVYTVWKNYEGALGLTVYDAKTGDKLRNVPDAVAKDFQKEIDAGRIVPYAGLVGKNSHVKSKSKRPAETAARENAAITTSKKETATTIAEGEEFEGKEDGKSVRYRIKKFLGKDIGVEIVNEVGSVIGKKRLDKAQFETDYRNAKYVRRQKIEVDPLDESKVAIDIQNLDQPTPMAASVLNTAPPTKEYGSMSKEELLKEFALLKAAVNSDAKTKETALPEFKKVQSLLLKMRGK